MEEIHGKICLACKHCFQARDEYPCLRCFHNEANDCYYTPTKKDDPKCGCIFYLVVEGGKQE